VAAGWTPSRRYSCASRSEPGQQFHAHLETYCRGAPVPDLDAFQATSQEVVQPSRPRATLRSIALALSTA